MLNITYMVQHAKNTLILYTLSYIYESSTLPCWLYIDIMFVPHLYLKWQQ